MGTVVTLRGKRGVGYKAVVRKRGVMRTKTFRRVALARQWITATEAAIDSGSSMQAGQAKRERDDEVSDSAATVSKPTDLPIDQRPWYTLEEACALLGLKKSSGGNLIHLERFPVPHEKLGRRNVVLKDVMNAFFDDMRQRGLEALRARDEANRRRPR